MAPATPIPMTPHTQSVWVKRCAMGAANGELGANTDWPPLGMPPPMRDYVNLRKSPVTRRARKKKSQSYSNELNSSSRHGAHGEGERGRGREHARARRLPLHLRF